MDPGDCYSEIHIDDSGSLTPLKDTFTVGEVLTMEINIPVEVENTSGEKLNLFEIFNKETIVLTGLGNGNGLMELFEGNQFNIIKGELTENFFVNLQYNEDTGFYEFLCEIELLKEGDYLTRLFAFSIFLGNDEDNCSENKKITSNFTNIGESGTIGNFTVTTDEQ